MNKGYKVTIQSRNDKGISTEAPTEAYGFSGESVPTVLPAAPSLVSPTANGGVLTWNVLTEADTANVNGFFRGYRLEWCNADVSAEVCEKHKRFQVG
ncbi:unnamed protein product [Protopolystoma xenopodis]|uniref:Uncharacterized protein n=1 Tax=Protopolystoma xenopodis TaxID=117903 RepID=A0A3S4ZVG6_9PLAT|nr:unnamed protein product [Protopolystoma xenopodis]